MFSFKPSSLYPRERAPKYLLNMSQIGPRAGLDASEKRRRLYPYREPKHDCTVL
jgi:hypothetical protein